MMNPSNVSIPIELMQLLTAINDNLNEVKERIARIEAQDHSDSLKAVRLEIKEERDKRIQLEIALANIKTKLAPILVGVSIASAVVLEIFIKSF